MKVFLARSIEKLSPVLLGGIRIHVHAYEVSLEPSGWGQAPVARCRCGKRGKSNSNWTRDSDVNSMYPFQVVNPGWKKGQKVIIATSRGIGKTYYKNMAEAKKAMYGR